MSSTIATLLSFSIALTRLEPASATDVPTTPSADDTAPSADATTEPSTDLETRAALLAELYHAVALDRTQHERLVNAYRAALRRARELGDESYVDVFLLGLARAYALWVEQGTNPAHRDSLVASLDDLLERILCRTERQDDDVVQLEDARLLRKRYAEPGRPWPECPRKKTAPIPPPKPMQPVADDATTPASSRPTREIALLASGSVVVAAGLTAILVGAFGKAIAQNSGRLSDPPTTEQQAFLDDTLPRRRAAWIGAGSAALLGGVALLTAGGVLLARRNGGNRRAQVNGSVGRGVAFADLRLAF